MPILRPSYALRYHSPIHGPRVLGLYQTDRNCDLFSSCHLPHDCIHFAVSLPLWHKTKIAVLRMEGCRLHLTLLIFSFECDRRAGKCESAPQLSTICVCSSVPVTMFPTARNAAVYKWIILNKSRIVFWWRETSLSQLLHYGLPPFLVQCFYSLMM